MTDTENSMERLIIKATDIQTVQLRNDGEFFKLCISFSVGEPFDIKWKATHDNAECAKNTYNTIKKALANCTPYVEILEEEEYNRHED